MHLASNARARSAMTQIHWSKANRSKHYGYSGYDMLSYKPNLDQTPFIAGMSFDDESRIRCKEVLFGDLQRLIRDAHNDGITFKDFLNLTSNKTIATAPMVQEVIVEICEAKGFEVMCPSGMAKKSSKFAENDVIIPRRQLFFEVLNVSNLKKLSKSAEAGGK